MSCNLNIEVNSVEQALRAYTGSNNTLFTSYWNEIQSELVPDAFDANFVDYAKKYGIDVYGDKFNINETAKIIRQFYNKNHFDVNFDSKLNNKDSEVAQYGYSSIDARIEGIRHTTNIILGINSKLELEFNEKVKGSKKQFYADETINKIEDLFIERLANKFNEDEIWDAIEAEDFITLDKMVASLNNLQTSNLYALYKEVISNRENFFNKVYEDSRLGSNIRFDKNDSMSEDSTYEQAELREDEGEDPNNPEDDNNGEDSSIDKTTQRWNDSPDKVSNILNTIDQSIKSYLGSLKKLHSNLNGGLDFNTDNLFGIPDVMDAEECCSVLYSDEIDYTSSDTMMKSIQNVAKNIDGYQAFNTLYNDLQKDSELRYKFYHTFGQFGIIKLETVADGNITTSRTSNRNLSKQTCLRFEFMNSAKSTALKNDDISAKAVFKQLNEKVSNLDSLYTKRNKVLKKESLDEDDKNYLDSINSKIDITEKEIIADLANQLKQYYPTVEDTSISYYCKSNNNGDIINNFKKLASILELTIKGSYATQNTYNARQLEIEQAKLHNKDPKNKDNKINIKDLYANPYISKNTETAAIELADELFHYSPVHTEINSRNVHGNQSSDIIPNSMITNLMNTLKSTIATENYGKYKAQTRQYDFSNILVEHRENGKIVNFGLFTKTDNNDFVPTKYAHRLLQARLFNGATDAITSKNVLYSEMSKGDYIATSIINFFNVEKDFNDYDKTGDNIAFANYFMRIPSDAPKNFIIKAPKYSAKGLFTIANPIEAQADVMHKINMLDRITNQEAQIDLMTGVPTNVSLKKLLYHTTAKQPGNIVIQSSNLNESNPKIGDTVTAHFQYKDKDGNVDIYAMKGVLQKDGDRLLITKPQFVSFLNQDGKHTNEVRQALINHYTTQGINSGEIERIVNNEHPLFKQLHNIFIQELTDAVNALDLLFVNNNGIIDVDTKTGMPKFKPGYDNTEITGKRLFATYHVGKSGTVLEKVEGKVWKLTGKVFTSDRFVITEEVKVGNEIKVKERNFGNEIINEAFDFLYGGGRKAHIPTKQGTNGVSVDYNAFTQKQKDIINKKLIEFINEYIKDTKNRLNQYKDFVPEKYQTDENIAEFTLNHLVMFANFNDLFEGDTKFYKDSQTFLKRAKEAQAGGTPYGNTNYAVDMRAEPVKVASRLDETIFKQIDANGNIIGTVQYELRDKFVGVTVKNTIRTNKDLQVEGVDGAKEDGPLVKSLANVIYESFRKDGMKAKVAKELALERARDIIAGPQRDGRHGYHGTKVNDAQSYITFEEWIRRVTARGQFMKYKPLIDAINDESKPLDTKTIGEFVQVQKNFYFDQYCNTTLRTTAPRQIKNAEFVLVPRFIRGTQLEKVYQLMKDKGIDQLNTEETSKAGKANVLTLWDNDGNLHIEEFEAKAKEASEYFSYNNLYTQQETPQHMDAENKAGIQIMKKIVDNISPESPLWRIKEDFFNNYIANIKESYHDVMDRLGVELDENGQLQYDENGEIKSLDKQILFDMLKEEMMRQGLDSNALDYVTLNDDENSRHNGVTKVPTYFGNKAVKLESIAQSIFNSGITRQKLPGFHAAQITNIGFRPFSEQVDKYVYTSDLQYHPKEYQLKDGDEVITEREYVKLSPSDKKKYKYKGTANYIEVKLPAGNFGIQRITNDGKLKSDEELLQELKNSGLDMMIGYRIPTESKHSICVMRVVGFTDDAQGSTIVVPDDWVSQTGSDFDIDSIYGINFKGRINKRTGKIEKIEYHENATSSDYANYLNKKLNNKANINKKAKEEIKKFIDEHDIYDLQIDEIRELESIAYNNGFETFEEFKHLDTPSLNTRDARNNRILEDMIKILSSDEAMEENMSPSNFEDLTTARDECVDENVKIRRELRSPYNFLDQADYQEDAVSGLKLKAFSVTRDTFCSICNTVRPILTGTNIVSVLYMEADGYNLEQLEHSFDDVKEIGKDKNGKGIYRVNHDTFGWSKNNRNVVGKLITDYTCQTTAHILDAIKEGAIPNVNDFTFQVYKMFPDFGSDYRTGVPFIMQPGVSAIVAEYNANRSIYSRGNSNPIHTAFKKVAKQFLELNGIDIKENASLDEYYNKLKYFAGELGNLFGAVELKKLKLDDKYASSLNIIGSRLRDRLKSRGKFTSTPVGERNKLLFDLGVIIQFNHLNNIASSIGAYARVCNPDKFGAKQTIFATDKVFDDINDIKDNEGIESVLSVWKEIYHDSPNGDIGDGFKRELSKEYKEYYEKTKDPIAPQRFNTYIKLSLLEAIYPNIYNNENISNENILKGKFRFKSAYPPLEAFLKYATATSIKINRTLFETQSEDFRSELKKIEDLFTHGQKLNEKVYKQLQSYFLNYLYGQTQAVSNIITYKKGKGFVFNKDGNLEEERRRIFGYGKSSRIEVKQGDELVPFKVQDINNPTETEITQFATLSPAQKVAWIQQASENPGIFGYLKTSLFNDKQSGSAYAGAQTIRYVENNASIETVYNEFKQAFYNDNPLVAMAAMDLIKYAFVVEGYQMKKNAVNKVISNDALIDNTDENGTGIITELNNKIGTIANASEDMERIRENFIRSHSNMSQITTTNVEKNDKGLYELSSIDDMIYFSNDSNNLVLAEKYGVVYEDIDGEIHSNKYVKLKFGRDIRLYKIIDSFQGIILCPLNKLEENENSDFSVNSENNQYNKIDYYETVANKWLARTNTEEDFAEFTKNYKDLKKSTKFVPSSTIDKGVKDFNLYEKGTVNTNGFQRVIDKTIEHFSTHAIEPLYMRSPVLTNFIKYSGPLNGIIKEIDGKKYLIEKWYSPYWNELIINNKTLPKKKLGQLDESLRDIIENVNYALNDVYKISPVKEENNIINDDSDRMFSSVDEVDFGTRFIEDIQSTAIAENDEDASRVVQYFKDKDITTASESVRINVDDVISLAAKYITTNVEAILNEFDYYTNVEEEQPDGTIKTVTARIDDPRVINNIRNNPADREKFLKTILKARAFVRNYQMINELDIDSKDESIRKNLAKIKDAINKLSTSSKILTAEENFANEYLAKLSDNPLVRQQVITLLDGYHSAGVFDAWVNDLQETSNPLIQIVTKEVMGDIRAKEMQAYKEIEKIKQKIEDIKTRAKAAGVNINWDNIVDENGKLIQDYIEAFVDKIDELRNAIEEAKANFGDGSIEHIKAQYEYNKFKLNHVNQELIDDYYQERLELNKFMIDNFPTIFSEYKKLNNERRKILAHAKSGILEGDKLDEYKKIKQEIDNLVKPVYYDETTDSWIPKKDGSDPSNPFAGNPRLLNIYNSVAAKALRDYLEKNADINKRYFEDQNKYGFDEELERNLEIVESYEKRVNGRITTPTNILAMHDDYVKAKSWLEVNTRFVLNTDLNDKLNAAYKVLRETQRGRNVLNKIVKDNNLRDRDGVIRATELTDEQIDKIREEQLDNYNLREGQPWQDTSLISNRPDDDTIFKTEFYEGMRSNGITNPDYLDKVQKINTILGRHYDSVNKTVNTSDLTLDELEQLNDLYDALEDTKKTVNSTNGQEIKQYIDNNVDFLIDEDKYNEQRRLVGNTTNWRNTRYRQLWINVNLRYNEDGTEVVPNRMLYGYAIPKGYKADGTGDNSMVDKEKTEALRTIRKYTQKVNSTYYYDKFREMSRKSDAEFNEWFDKNHVYNPYTRIYEPLACWTTIQYITDDPTETIGEYLPAYNQTDSVPKDNVLNSKYKGKGSSTASNYKSSKNVTIPGTDFSDGIDYSNHNAMNQYEKEMKDLVEEIIRINARTTEAKNFFKQGYMIARAKNDNKDAKFYLKEASKMIGWINTATGTEAWTEDEDVDYATDKNIPMPFVGQLKNKDSKKISYKRPIKKDTETDNEYEDRVKEWEKNNKEAKEVNAKIHAELLDRDFENVIEDFILKSAHYNAVQDNKYMLFYAKNMLDRLDVYVKNEGFNNLQRNHRRSTDEENRYVTKKDTRLQEQYINWIRRLVYDQWKKPNNKLTRAANIAQSLTSAKFMMLNVTGGIANVTVGYTQIYAEMLANEYFGKVNAALGLATWGGNIGSFIADMYSDKATSVASAIIKIFNVVDFDELNGVISVADAEEYMKRVRDIAFSPQAIGEHMMQNGALFSMLYSHRLFKDDTSSETGRLSYRVKNEAEHLRDAEDQALFNVIKDNAELQAKFEKFKQDELSDANKKKEYAWFRKYLSSEFANIYLNNEERREFIKERRRLQEEAKKEFNNDEAHPTLMSQFKLDNDGKLGFNDDSILTEMGDEAWQLIGRFKGRVISVNKKIHGVYDKLGAAKLESYWWGSLVMQYHKHIYPGIMKRYRRQGYFNEERGTIEKGCYAAIKDFLAIPLHQAEYAKKLQKENGMSNEEISATQGIQNIVRNYVEFATHVRLYWNIIPENERGNIKRAVADFAGALSAVCTAIGLRCLADHDEDGLVYNLMMYEADRLASESMMYNPFGLISEGKKLWSSPVAVQGAITDMFHTVGFISQYIIQGDEFDDTYQSGMYSGEHKIEVFVKRNIPMYHSIYMLERLQKSNKYYKLGDNMLSIIPIKDIADFINK